MPGAVTLEALSSRRSGRVRCAIRGPAGQRPRSLRDGAGSRPTYFPEICTNSDECTARSRGRREVHVDGYTLAGCALLHRFAPTRRFGGTETDCDRCSSRRRRTPDALPRDLIVAANFGTTASGNLSGTSIRLPAIGGRLPGSKRYARRHALDRVGHLTPGWPQTIARKGFRAEPEPSISALRQPARSSERSCGLADTVDQLEDAGNSESAWSGIRLHPG